MDKRFTICVAENRGGCEPGVRLLLASLSRYRPEWPVQLFYPPADANFREWLGRYPQVALNALPPDRAWDGYDIKPTVLRTLLDAGWEEVVWIDSDIIVAADPASAVARTSPDAVIVTEEANIATHGSFGEERTRLWNLPVGRALPFALNSCVLGLTPRHLDLLERWEGLLANPEYRAAQAGPHGERPVHMLGDQEVLTALLASDEFAGLPLHILRRGAHIIQYLGTVGYTTRERMRHLVRGLPPFIHSQGYKAWWPLAASESRYDRFLDLYKLLAPYRIAARGHASALEDAAWLTASDKRARHLDRLGFGSPALTGLPLALLVDVSRKITGRRH